MRRNTVSDFSQVRPMPCFAVCKIVFLFIALFQMPAFAQTTTTFPPVSSCTSKDLSLVSATLTGGDACNSCTAGQTLTRNLVLAINNKTGSTRTAFSFWGTLEITHADGTMVTTPINRCSGPVPPTGPLPASYSGGSFGTITYQCGDALRLTNLFLAWTDASANRTCAALNSATINPKCGTLPAIRINAGVNSAFSVVDATCTTNGSIAVSPFGGTAPYTVTCNSVVRNNIAAGATTTFTNLPAGNYPVLITDANGCAITLNRTVGTPTPLGIPTASVTDPTCTVATGSCAVNSPAAGVVYTLRQNGNVMYTAVNGMFSGVAPGDYQFVASNGTCSTNGSDKHIGPQPATPSAPSVCIVQPSLCGPSTGSVTILSPTGAGYEYSIDNGSTWQSSPEFSNVAAGSVTGIKAKKDGCVSDAASCDDSDCSANKITQAPKEAVQAIAPVKVVPIQNEAVGFRIFPVPMKDRVTIKYDFNYLTDIRIDILDSNGMLLFTQADRNNKSQNELTVDLNFAIKSDQIYFVRVTTSKGTTVKTVVSSK